MTIFNFGFLNPFANGAPSNEIEAFPDENRGLGIAFDQTEGKPEMKGLNGLFNKITQSLLSIKQNGLIGWTNDIEYIAGGFTVENGKLYQAIRNNTNKQPSLSQSDWSLWSPISSISVSTNGNLKRTVDANGAMTLEVPTASDTQRGAVRAATATEVANKSNVNAYVTPSNVATIAQSTDLGVGQTWQDLTSGRSSGVTYTNNTEKPIEISVTIMDDGSAGSQPVTIIISGISSTIRNLTQDTVFSYIIPVGGTYRFNITTNTIHKWMELR